jgi:transposase
MPYYDAGMRGDDRQPEAMFSYISMEQRVPKEHPLRAIRALVDEILRDMSREFDGLYARVGRPSIPPERLLRAQEGTYSRARPDDRSGR